MVHEETVAVKRGNRLGIGVFRLSARAFGLRGAYGLLYIVCLYYLAFDRQARSSSLAYLRRRFPEHGRLRLLRDAYRLLIEQGKSLVDRYAILAGAETLDVRLEASETRDRVLADKTKGFILLTAHIGNWQAAMFALRRFGRTVHVMMRPEDNAAVRDSLKLEGAEERVRFLFTDDSLGGVIEAMKAIERGEIVSIMGDRAYEYAAADVSFLGGTVRFPVGAFTIAAAAKCPLVVLLSARTGVNRYSVDVSRQIEPPAGRRKEKDAAIRAAVQEFARVLEEYVAEHPYQWFAFRDLCADAAEQ